MDLRITAGETFSYTLRPRQAGETVRAAIKRLSFGDGPPPASEPELAVFNVSTDAEGWVLTLTAAQTAALGQGAFVFDERITLATGDVQITDVGKITVVPSVTGAGA
jgi:hypothetical protein